MSIRSPIGLPGAPIVVVSDDGIAGALPRELLLELDLPVVQGAGELLELGPGEYAGVLSVTLPPLSATAFGVLGLPAADRDLSFLLIVGATFPPPGIQLGFGFAVSGLGGVVGVNRRIDRDALMRGVADGSVANLLFPSDPVGNARAVIAGLPAIFPHARGSVVAGPMLQLSWGGRLVTASVAVLLEVSDTVRLSILGKLVVALPDPLAPLVLLQASFAGQIDPGEPSVSLLASLTGSQIVGMPLNGDLYLLTRGGANATFVLSAGGFHPTFARPYGVPALRRIGIDLSPYPLIELRCEAYFAVTPNTVQFGARVELVAEVAGCGLRGHLGFDALIQFAPQVSFIAQMSAGIAIRVLGRTLVGISLDLSLSGPSPWRARGRGEIDLFLFSACFDFDEQWGQQPALPSTAPDVRDELKKALETADAWLVRRAEGAASVRLTRAADRALGTHELVDPYGSLTARQQAVPLGVTIDRFGRLPVAPQRWDITEVRIGGVERPSMRELRAEFAPGQFLAMNDDEQLSRPAFAQFVAGAELVAGPVQMAPALPADIDFEQRVLIADVAVPFAFGFGLWLQAHETIANAPTASDPLWWQAPATRITVADETPVAAASTWSLAAEPDVAASATATELRQALALGRPGVSVVEAWELAG